MIDLKDFVKETMTQITEALTEYAVENVESGANPNPHIKRANADNAQYLCGTYNDKLNRYETVMPIEFDVAVTAQEASSKDGKAGIKVWGVTAGGGISAESTNSSVSRISFKVPLQLPNTNGIGDVL